MKYIDPDGQFAHDHDWVLDSLYLTWQDMWDASHSDDRNDHWDPDKAPPKREHRRNEINDFPIDAFGIEFTGAFVEVLGVSGSITFVIDENWDFKIFATEQLGEGGETPGVSTRLVFSSMSSEELVNATDTVAAECEVPTFVLPVTGSAQWSGKPGGPPQTLHIGVGYPTGFAAVRYNYVKSYLIYD
jgi:hypothetical protein